LKRNVRAPFLFTLVVFLILVQLGAWQLRRLHWKEGLLARIDIATRNPPVPLAGAPEAFTKVVVTGTWDVAHKALYGTDVRRGQLGAYVIEPLLRAGMPPVLVDRGFVANGVAVPDAPGEVRVVGYVRDAEPGSWWGIKDDLREWHFYALDARAIAREMGMAQPESFTLVAMGDEAGPPEPARGFPELSNNHLSYALQWFSFAVIDWVVFGVWWWKARRLPSN
jgi:surfeit locus 1 family protein